MKVDIVIGANYGDESKGTVVARCAKNSGRVLNVLTNGGSQRGHTVTTKRDEHVFKHFGSGTFFGAHSFFCRDFILNPMQYVKELRELNAYRPVAFRDEKCLWSTPFDMMANQILEQRMSRHASCGMGIWMTIVRSKFINCTFDEFLSAKDIDPYAYIRGVKKYYEQSVLKDIPEEWKSIWNNPDLIKNFIADCVFMKNEVKSAFLDDDFISLYDKVVFENGQGLLLSDDGKDDSCKTPSKTGLEIPSKLLKNLSVNPENVTVHYVTRPYLTRHGDDERFSSYSRSPQNISSFINPDKTNYFNNFQGRFQYAELDLNNLKKRVDKDFLLYGHSYNRILELTHCDEMDREKDFSKMFKNLKSSYSAIV